MAYDHAKQQALNLKHRAIPMVGDYWHDQFSPCYLIVDVGPFHVALLDQAHIKRDGDGYTYDTSKPPVVITKGEFEKRITYESMDKTWADVVPHQEERRWAVDEVIARWRPIA